MRGKSGVATRPAGFLRYREGGEFKSASGCLLLSVSKRSIGLFFCGVGLLRNIESNYLVLLICSRAGTSVTELD